MNQNGQIVLHILQQFNEPATFTQIHKRLAEMLNSNPKTMREEVKSILAMGVESGFVQCQRNRYYIKPLTGIPGLTDLQSPQSNDSLLDHMDDDQPAKVEKSPERETGPEAVEQQSEKSSTSSGARRGRSQARKPPVTETKVNDMPTGAQGVGGGAVKERAGRKRKPSKSPKRGKKRSGSKKRSMSKGRAKSRSTSRGKGRGRK